jgi:hypothetical protein
VTEPGVSETIWPNDDLLSASQIRVPDKAVFPSQLERMKRHFVIAEPENSVEAAPWSPRH